MKLPKNANIGQQRIATVSSSLPSSVANAEARANNSFGRAMDAFSEVAMDVYRTDAAAEHNSLNAEYKMKENEMRSILQQNPYAENEDGTMRSRHTEIVDEYEKSEKQLRKSIMDKSTNNMAGRKLAQDFESSFAQTRNAVHATAVNWAVESATAKNAAAFQNYVENYQYDEAGRVMREGIALGQFDEETALKMDNTIAEHATYNGLANRIKQRGPVSNKVALARYAEVNKDWNHMSDRQKMAAKGAIFQNRLETYSSGIRKIIEGSYEGYPGFTGINRFDPNYKDMVGSDFGGLADGKYFLRQVAHMTPEELGVETQEEKHKLFSTLSGVHNEYKLGLEADFGNMKADNRCNEILAGAQASDKKIAGASDQAKAMGVTDDPAAMNCAFGKSTEGHEPWSDEWIKRGIAREIRDQGYLSKEATRWVNQAIINPDANPEAFVKAANVIGTAMKEMRGGRAAFEHLSDDSKALVKAVNNLADYSGGDTTQSLEFLKNNTFNQDPLHIQARTSDYNARVKPELTKTIQKYFSGTFGKPLDPAGGDIIVPMEMQAEVNEVAQEYVKTYGDVDDAVEMAIDKVATAHWSVSSRDTENQYVPWNDVKFAKDMPETVLRNQAPPEKLKPMLDQDWKDTTIRYGIPPHEAEVGQMVTREDGSVVWPIMKRGGKEFHVMPSGEVAFWGPDYNNSTYNDLEQFEAKKARRIAEHEFALEKISFDEKNGSPEEKQSIMGTQTNDPANIPNQLNNLLVDTVFPFMFDPPSPDEQAKLDADREADRAKYRKLKEWRESRDMQKLMKSDPFTYKRVLETMKGSDATHEEYMERQDILKRRQTPGWD